MPPPHRTAPATEERARSRLAALLASDATLHRLELGTQEAVVRALLARSRLLVYLDAHPLVDALDALEDSLPPGDDGILVGFWARGEARAAGASVPFGAAGLERLLGAASKS